MSDPNSYKLQRDIQELIRQRLEETKEDVLKLAVLQFERRLRDELGKVAINIANYYSIQRLGPDLVITVKMDDLGEGHR